MDRVDCIVIGAGVVGLACARAIAQAGLEVLIIERETAYGTGVSARNSEVIHAGLYYPTGSRKAQWGVRGARLLYDHCAQRGIAHRRCGKLLVATREADVAALEALRAKGLANGVAELEWLTRAQAMALEPELQCVAALWSPASGIVDSHGLMTSLLGDAEAAGALLAVTSGVVGATRDGDGWRVRVRTAVASDSGGDFQLAANWIVNAAGLDAQAVATSTTRSMRAVPTPLQPKSAATGRACPRARWHRPTAASSRSSAARASLPPTSGFRARPTTAARVWCSCSASSRPGSPRRLRLRRRWLLW